MYDFSYLGLPVLYDDVKRDGERSYFRFGTVFFLKQKIIGGELKTIIHEQ